MTRSTSGPPTAPTTRGSGAPRSAAEGRIRAGGLERDVVLREYPDGDVHSAVDKAYHTKYDRYGPRIVGSVVGPSSPHAGTLRLLP